MATIENEPKVISTIRGVAPESAFKPGVYRHYKGGLYWAMTIGWINEIEPRERAVFYLSMTTGEWHARPYEHESKDAWTDIVFVEDSVTGLTVSRARFEYVGPQPIPGRT
jgi:hypothetical protein